MYKFKNSAGVKIGGPVATRRGAHAMALHMANKRDEPITVIGPTDSFVVYPSAED